MESLQGLEQEWYVVYSKPHQEERAQYYLRLRGVHVFLPRLDLPGGFQKKKRLVPLFPNYLFVQVHLSTQSQYVIWSPGVKGFVHFGGTPLPLEDSVVDFLKHQADSAGIIKARSRLKPGQEVEIQEGPFAGLFGVIQEPPDDKGRVKVLLRLLSRQISVELRAQFLKGEWAPCRANATVGPASNFLSVPS